VEEAAYFSQSASPAFGWRVAYAIRALPDLCFGIVSKGPGHLDPWIPFMVSTPLKAPARPGLSFVPKLECWRKGANFTRQGSDLLRVFVTFFVTDERL
jgi:hypothetical protein